MCVQVPRKLAHSWNPNNAQHLTVFLNTTCFHSTDTKPCHAMCVYMHVYAFWISATCKHIQPLSNYTHPYLVAFYFIKYSVTVYIHNSNLDTTETIVVRVYCVTISVICYVYTSVQGHVTNWPCTCIHCHKVMWLTDYVHAYTSVQGHVTNRLCTCIYFCTRSCD